VIAVDTNLLVRYLVDDDAEQAQAARALLEGLSSERPGFICREVAIETVWVLERAYGFSRDQIASVLEELVSTDGLVVEAADDVARASLSYRIGGPGFSDLMILAAADRAGASPLYTFDHALGRLGGACLIGGRTRGAT
jgi:predicted nucleic-acid-binding protein